MFCTVKKNKNKYVVYLSERVREGGKVKSRDKYLFTLKAEEIENRAYSERIQFSCLSEDEKQLIRDKLDGIVTPLQATTESKSLHNTTGARIEFEIKVANDCRFIAYKFYAGDILICELCDFEFECIGLGAIMIGINSLIKEKGVTNKKTIEYLKVKAIDIYEYYDESKRKREAERSEAAAYYENTILALQLKIAELQNNSSRTSLHTTTDTMKVKKIYRALASKLHPDNGGSDELMQMLNELKDMIN